MTSHRLLAPLLVMSLAGIVAVYVLSANQVLWAAPDREPLHQLVPTQPPHTVGQATQLAATPTSTPSSTRAGASGIHDETTSRPLRENLGPSTSPQPFHTPVYGMLPSSSGSQGSPSPVGPASLKDSFARVFPVWCFWPVAGLILVVAGMDLRAKCRPKR